MIKLLLFGYYFMLNISEVIAVIALVLINGFFVASETALLQVRQTKIASLTHKKNRLAKLMKIALTNMEIYISATQIGNTIVSIALGSLGHPILEKMLSSFLPIKSYPLHFFLNASVIAISAFIILTLFNLIFGELLPKLIVIYNPLFYGMILILPLSIFVMVFLPVINAFNRFTRKILQLLGIATSLFDNQDYSVKEIKIILNESVKDRVISQAEKIIALNVFRLKTIKIKKIMIELDTLVGYMANDTLETIKKQILTSHLIYNRYPIFADSSKRIIGFIHITDIFNIRQSNISHKKISRSGLIRKVLTVHETDNADSIIIEMNKKKLHVANVIDQTGKSIGLLIFSDLIHSLLMEEDEIKKIDY